MNRLFGCPGQFLAALGFLVPVMALSVEEPTAVEKKPEAEVKPTVNQEEPEKVVWDDSMKPVLLKEFQKAQWSSVQALKHRQKMEMDEYLRSKGPRIREWDRIQEAERERFFFENKSDSARREYRNQKNQERQKLAKEINQEGELLRQRHQDNLKRLMDHNKMIGKKFRESIKNKQVPSKDLWPSSSGIVVEKTEKTQPAGTPAPDVSVKPST